MVVGHFDGVHLGHQHVIQQAREYADARGLTLVAVTFDPHPLAVLRPEHAPTTLTTIEQRAELLTAAGADEVLAIPFSREIAAWTPDEFATKVIVETLHATVCVVGKNFTYGCRASGDATTLREFGLELPESDAFEVEVLALDGGPIVWSSTYIRTCLAAGDVEGAAEALGRPYSVRGIVVHGQQRGRELGFPTANVPTAKLTAVPTDGVYAGWLTRRDTGETWACAISVGTNPTFDGVIDRRVESYVIDQTDLDLYGVEVEVAFVAHLRGMEAFDSVESLIVQMKLDVDRARTLLSS